MQLCSCGQNANSTSWTHTPVRTMSNFSFSVRHSFQFRFWPHRRNSQVILRQRAIFHPYRITSGGNMTSGRLSKWQPIPASISVISPQLACYLASGCWVSFRSDHPLRKYDVISIFQDGDRNRSILLPEVPVSYWLMLLYSEGQSLLSNQISSTCYIRLKL